MRGAQYTWINHANSEILRNIQVNGQLMTLSGRWPLKLIELAINRILYSAFTAIFDMNGHYNVSTIIPSRGGV